MDDELDGKCCRESLEALSHNTEARDKWSRYHLVRELLIEENVVLAEGEFSEKIASAIATEPHRIGSTRWLKTSENQLVERNWWKQAVGFAVAASVAALVVTSVNNMGPDLQKISAPEQFSNHFAPIIDNIVPASANYKAPYEAPNLQDRKRLQRLFLQHTMSASENGLKGILPYAKVVSYRRIPTQVANIETPHTTESQSRSKDLDSSKQP